MSILKRFIYSYLFISEMKDFIKSVEANLNSAISIEESQDLLNLFETNQDSL